MLRRTLIGLSLCGALLVVGISEDVRAFSGADRALYVAATAVCRTRPAQKLFDELTKVVCFDGQILSNEDVSFIRRLPEHGLFVVRSPGGRMDSAYRIARVLNEKHADVVVYDYCISACADMLFVASDRTYVMRDSIVAWHFGRVDEDTCGMVDRSGGSKRLRRTVCSTGALAATPGLFAGAFRSTQIARANIGRETTISADVRRQLISWFEGTGVFRDILWTWNPRYYKPLLRTEIEYESYPESQDQLDALVERRFGTNRVRIIYDP